jgi:hypothetical protein
MYPTAEHRRLDSGRPIKTLSEIISGWTRAITTSRSGGSASVIARRFSANPGSISTPKLRARNSIRTASWEIFLGRMFFAWQVEAASSQSPSASWEPE